MVYLKRIETKGFKSMGSKVMSTPVEKGFIAITGPNGSGKSNLLDAVLFALGENSAKTLRVPNLGALIYDGSVEEQKPSSARATLQFDNTDRRIPIDSDSVTISRELKQTGESIYSLNGKHVQRNSLSELLEMALITSRGLNIVLQGMITRISELVPDEKRKLIEQMVGVAQFDEKKDQALLQLREADVKLEVAMAKIGEIRDRVQLLEQQRNDQLRMKQLEEHISWMRAATTSAKLSNVRRTLQLRRDATAELSSRLQQLQTRLSEITGSVEVLDRQRNELIKSAMDAGAAKVELELGKLNSEISLLERERQEAADFLDRVRQIIPTLEQMSSAQEVRIGESESHVALLQQKIKEAETKKADLLSKLNQLNIERQSFEKEISVYQSKVVEFRRLKYSHDTKLQKAKEDFNKLSLDLRASEEKKITIQEKMRFFTESLSTAQKNITDLEQILSSNKAQLEQVKQSRTSVEKLRKRVEEQLDIAFLILEKAQTAVTRYDSEVSAIQDVAAEEIALTRLESLGDANAIDGYFGPLRTLIKYDPQFTQAIGAVGKDWLNAIVVRDVPSLIRTTEAAKKLKISRLTAIPLREVGEFNHFDRSVKSVEGQIDFVSDAISCDPKIKSIVNFVFGDSVIVNSPSNAFIAARKGFRAVTLQGDVFEPDLLAFETGYSKKFARISNILNQQEGFESVKSALGALKSIIDKRKTSISKLHSSVENYQKNEQEQDLNISKIETKLETTKQFIQRYAESVNSFKLKLRETEEEINDLHSKIRSIEKQVQAYSLGSQKMDSILSGFDLSAFDARSADLNKKRMEIDSTLESVIGEIRDTTTEITRIRGDLENNQKPALERLKQQRLETRLTFEQKSKLLIETEPKLRELEGNLAKLKEMEAETIERANRFQPLLDEIDSNIKLLKSEEDSLRRSITSTDREFFSANSDLARLTESERMLVGELAIYGFAEPVESFEGADILLKELSVEYDALKNNVNLLADRNYRDIFENYKYSSVRRNDLEKERNAIVTFIETIDAEKRSVFMEAFERIDKEIRVIFNKITNGNAWLEIEKPDSIFDSGVFLMAQFPGKLPRDSSSVSGGEKTISALSFILAIQAVFPSPFYVFDEVDAHLDSVYSGKLAEILAERSVYSQIIIVSLKDTVVSKASAVIGVYMSQGSSRVIRYKSGMEVEVRTE